jgi:hypothetical protein
MQVTIALSGVVVVVPGAVVASAREREVARSFLTLVHPEGDQGGHGPRLNAPEWRGLPAFWRHLPRFLMQGNQRNLDRRRLGSGNAATPTKQHAGQAGFKLYSPAF